MSTTSPFAAALISSLLARRGERLLFGGVDLAELAERHGTPFYAYDAAVMRTQLDALRRALPWADVHYSVLAGAGAGCEIASAGEYARARRAGVPADRILFAGPGKTRADLEHVVTRGVGEIHVEGFDEIEALAEIAGKLDVDVDVAVRVNSAGRGAGGLVMGGQPTAFGFEEESLAAVVERLASSPRLRLRGVHVYGGTQILDAAQLVDLWRDALDIAARLAALAGCQLTTVDLGGGLGIPYFAHEKPLDLAAVQALAGPLVAAAQSQPALAQSRFIVEPGRYLTGPAGVYVARVVSVKSCRGVTFAVLDGGMNHHLAASGNLGQVVRRDYPIVNLTRLGDPTEGDVVVVGPLCTPIDTIGRKVTMPRPRAGDLIGVLQSGAYGLTASPVGFLSHPTPAEHLVLAGASDLITPRGGIEP
jgi:diaminopimelate decarboxylase